jgi:hypothetical protein
MTSAAQQSNIDDSLAVDDDALRLRASGKSFGAIAKALGYERSDQANEAFNRALRRRPPKQRKKLRDEELVRLDAMADGVRSRPQLEPDDIARRLRGVERLRTLLLAD